MDPKSFCYWLQGYVEIKGERPTEEEWKVIKDHLQLVFETKLESITSQEGSTLTFPSTRTIC